MRLAPIAALLVASSISGCAARSANSVTSESIVALQPGVNLLRNAGFSHASARWWHVNTPAGVTARLAGDLPQRVLTITASRPGRRGRVYAEQATQFLPDTSAGAEYLLRVELRSTQVSRPLEVALRLDYAGGSSGRFAAAAVTGSTRGWETVAVRAHATRRLTAVEAFIVDSPPQPAFSGSVSVTDPELFSLHGAAPGATDR